MDGCDGVYGNMQEAIDELGLPRLKATRPVHSFRGQLTLGNPEQYESAMVIDVERYPRVMVRRPMTASNYWEPSKSPNGGPNTESTATRLLNAKPVDSSSTSPSDEPLAATQNSRIYQILAEDGSGAKVEVNREDLAKGYEYGRTAVHISESDLNVTKLETHAGLDILGFVPWAKVCLLGLASYSNAYRILV